MHKNIQWIYGSYFNIHVIHMTHPRHMYNIVFENVWWGRLIHKILTKKNPESRKFLKSWKSLSGGGGKAEFIPTTSISLFISSFHFNFLHGVEKSGGRGDSVFKHVNLRKSVCYDEKWVGVGGRPRPLMLRACILHVIQYYLYICMRSHWTR